VGEGSVRAVVAVQDATELSFRKNAGLQDGAVGVPHCRGAGLDNL